MPFNLDRPLSQETFSITTNNEAVEVIPDSKTNKLTIEFIASAVGQWAPVGTEGVALDPLKAIPVENSLGW